MILFHIGWTLLSWVIFIIGALTLWRWNARRIERRAVRKHCEEMARRLRMMGDSPMSAEKLSRFVETEKDCY